MFKFLCMFLIFPALSYGQIDMLGQNFTMHIGEDQVFNFDSASPAGIFEVENPIAVTTTVTSQTCDASSEGELSYYKGALGSYNLALCDGVTSNVKTLTTSIEVSPLPGGGGGGGLEPIGGGSGGGSEF